MNSAFSRCVVAFCCAILALWSSLILADTQNSYPMLMGLNPVAAQIGQTSEHEVDARYSLEGAYRIIISGTGVTGEVIPPEKPSEEKATDNKPRAKKSAA